MGFSSNVTLLLLLLRVYNETQGTGVGGEVCPLPELRTILRINTESLVVTVVEVYLWDGSTLSIEMIRSIAMSGMGNAMPFAVNVSLWACQNKSGRLTCNQF